MKSLPIPLELKPLTAADFSMFGDVIEADHLRSFLINEGRTRRYHALTQADPGEDGQAILSIFRGTPWPNPVTIRMVERHPLGSQSFIPMERSPWLIVVAEAARADACHAFYARGDQGVRIAKGVWHHPLLVLQSSQDFLVVDRDGPGQNLEEIWFPDGEAAVIAAI